MPSFLSNFHLGKHTCCFCTSQVCNNHLIYVVHYNYIELTELYKYIFFLLYTGSRSSLVNVEARSLDATSVARRCVLARLADLTPTHYHRLVSQGAAALLILLPANLTVLSQDESQVIHKFIVS